MRIYQTIHKYSPHIPQFEAKYDISDGSNITFDELRKLIVEDGYASSYILQPALEHNSKKVFYTVWDYERLQHLWAKEHGIETTDLAEIKLAQLEWFEPDVFYNMSPLYDNNFIEVLKLRGIQCKTVCWNGIIESRPMTFPFYDVHLTLHKPSVDYWAKLGLKAFELQPGIPESWDFENRNRMIDVLFYGQYYEGMFSNRNRLIDQLLTYKQESDFQIRVHLQYDCVTKDLIRIAKLGGLSITTYPSRRTRKLAQDPLYGSELYKQILRSKIVVNAYTDNNKDFKSNMRVFEAIGHGAFLISERGNYPDGLEPDIDFYTYEGFDELKYKIELVLADWAKHQIMAQAAAAKARIHFSKEKQWLRFQEILEAV